MKVLHLSGARVWGGNEQQLAHLIFNLLEYNVESHVFCFDNSPIQDFAKKNNVPYLSMEKMKPFSAKLTRLLANYVKEKMIDVIHIHTSNYVTTFMVADLKYKLSTPSIFSKKGISDKSSFLSAIKYNYKGINKVICVSQAVKKSFEQVLKKRNHHKLHVIYDGININDVLTGKKVVLRDMFKIPKEQKLIGNIANHSLAKDLPTFIKTANHLINIIGRKDVCFIQIGDKSRYTDELELLIKEYKLESNVILAGFFNDAKIIIPQFDLYVMTSQREGLPLTIYEAFLHKVPVVSTRAGGIPEAICDNKNGLLTEVGDFISLANKIDNLLDDENLRNDFVVNSYEKVINNFDALKLTEEVVELYNEVLNEKS